MRHIRSRHWLALPAAAAVVSLGVTQFAQASTAPTEPTTDTETASGSSAPSGDVDLSGVCPDTVIIQTDWFPEAEHGWLYQLVGADPVIDADNLTVKGPLIAGGVDTGVDIQINTGGPALGQGVTVSSKLYEDDSILLGYVYTDEAIQFASQFPTVAIFSGMEKNPQMIMWDPATYPDVHTIADLGTDDVTIRYFEGAAYMEYFAQTGVLSPDQLDGGYTGGPDQFVAAEGRDAQQGFGSAEPYIYENEVADWMKPVAFQYINDAGWDNYGESIATRPENLETYGDCFAKLVPILQQSSVDFLTDPTSTIDLILRAVDEFDSFWVYSPGVAQYGVDTMIADGLIGNGPNDTIGDFDLDRVNNLIDIARPVYAALGQEPPADLTADDIVTNQFIDPSIGLPAGMVVATTGTEAMGSEPMGSESMSSEAMGSEAMSSDVMTTETTES